MVHFEMTTKSARLELKNNKLTQQIKPRPKKEKTWKNKQISISHSTRVNFE